MPEISVIVPLYNARKYLREAIDSVLAQTFQDFEIIVVDDCSTDGSWDLVNRLYGENDKVRLHRHECNKTAGGARNTGLIHAKGKYVAFLDGDDLYMPEALSIMYRAAEEYQAEVVHSPGCLVPTGDQEHIDIGAVFRTIIFDKLTPEEKPVLLPADKSYRARQWASRRLYGTIWNKLVRKDFLDIHGIRFEEDIFPGEDALFLFRCVMYAANYVRIPEVFYIYRRPETSVTHSKKDAGYLAFQIRNMLKKIRCLDAYMEAMPYLAEQEELKDEIRAFAVLDTDPYFVQPGYYSGGLVEGKVEEIKKVFQDSYGVDGFLAYWFFHQYHLQKAGQVSQADAGGYVFPYHLFQEGERVAIYGAGEVGKAFYCQLMGRRYVKLAGIVDRRAGEIATPDFPVKPVENLKLMDFDAVLISVINGKAAGEIRESLMEMGIGADKIRWQGNAYAKDDYYSNYYFPLLRKNMEDL